MAIIKCSSYTTNGEKMAWFNNLGLGIKLRLILVLFAFGLIAFGLLSYSTIEELRINGDMYKKIVQGKDLVADILPPPDYIVETNLICYQMLNETDPAQLNLLVEKSKKLREEYYTRHEFWIKDLDAGEMKDYMVTSSFNPAEKFYNTRDEKFIPLIMANQREEAKNLLLSEMKNQYEEHRLYVDKVVSMANENNAKIELAAAASIKSRYIILLSIGLGLLIIIFFIVAYIFRKIKSAIVKVMDTILELSKGHVKVRASISSEDEIGVIAKSLNGLAINLDEFSKLMYKISDGDFTTESKAADAEDVLAPALNSITESLRNLIDETRKLTTASLEGNLSTRGDVERFRGNYKQIISGINSTLDAVIAPIQEASSVLRKMSEGDLTVRMEKDYQGEFHKIKHDLNTLGDSMSEALLEVAEVINATASVSTQISSSSEQMAAGAQEQGTQISEVAISLKQMSQTIIETTQNSSRVAMAAKNSGTYASEGGKVVHETIEGMNKIADVVLKTSETIKTLGQSSDQIGEITKVIDEIADQTNLLALNAAIEAARAGEQGRGFAVVADEVRKLAERTSIATKEIEAMIGNILTETSEAVVSMEMGKQEVLRGRELAGQAGNSLNQIIGGAQEVIDIASQVAAASEEQSSTAEQISSNIECVNEVSKESAAGIHEIAKASIDLQRLTQNLQALISKFKISVSDKIGRLGISAVK
jgi:methyl-accepting chemotaxis protein